MLGKNARGRSSEEFVMHPLARPAVLASVASFAFFAAVTPGLSDVVITIDKSSQRMSVAVDGVRRHSWAVSTGTGGGPPSGVYRPQRLERSWYSRKFGLAPMPHSIFFHEGYAIHGTTHVSRLGRRASHGCVRLHPSNAAALYAIVRSEGAGRTRIVVAR
ncbi:MAG: L,D-transpeptidase [Bradyrhizobiaceae bacterium]|nr:L,D-transpeptidase [Bradyrhizobiaceae bacterium]